MTSFTQTPCPHFNHVSYSFAPLVRCHAFTISFSCFRRNLCKKKNRKKKKKNRLNRYLIQMRPLNGVLAQLHVWLADRFRGIEMVIIDNNDDDKIQAYFYRCRFSPIHGDDVVRITFEIMHLEYGQFAKLFLALPLFFFFFHSFRHLVLYPRQSPVVSHKMHEWVCSVHRHGITMNLLVESIILWIGAGECVRVAECNRRVVKGSIIFEISSGFSAAVYTQQRSRRQRLQWHTDTYSSFWTFDSFIVLALSSGWLVWQMRSIARRDGFFRFSFLVSFIPINL